ncbi:MAG: hypothetical protein ACREC2_03305, partial [Bradyrhizobium sp.]
CTENTTALASGGADDCCWFAWSIWPAVLSGIASICTFALAAFRRANRRPPELRCSLKMPPGTSILLK